MIGTHVEMDKVKEYFEHLNTFIADKESNTKSKSKRKHEGQSTVEEAEHSLKKSKRSHPPPSKKLVDLESLSASQLKEYLLKKPAMEVAEKQNSAVEVVENSDSSESSSDESEEEGVEEGDDE